MAQQLATKQFDPLPSTLNSPEAKLVYFYIESTGGATLDDLNKTLVMKKISILSVLNSLSNEQLIEKVETQYVMNE